MAFDESSGAEHGDFNIGDKLLVQDCTDLEWYKGRVIESVLGQIKVHFVGWSTVWDEWIEDDSPRLKQWEGSRVRAKVEEDGGGGGGRAVGLSWSRGCAQLICVV